MLNLEPLNYLKCTKWALRHIVLYPCEKGLPRFPHCTNPKWGPPKDVSYSFPNIIFIVIAIAMWKIWKPHCSTQKEHGLVASVSLLTGRRKCLLCGHALPRHWEATPLLEGLCATLWWCSGCIRGEEIERHLYSACWGGWGIQCLFM